MINAQNAANTEVFRVEKAVEPQDVGGTLGISASLESLTRVIAPAVGGFLLAQFGAIGPGLFTALVMFWVVSFVWRHLVHGTDAMPPATGSQGGEMIGGSAG